MQDALKNTIENAMGKAREMILGGDEVLRVFFAIDKDGSANVVVAPATGDDEDNNLIPYLRMMFAILGVRSYCMMSEVWMSRRATREGPRPSEDPDRIEALVALGIERITDDAGKTQTLMRMASAQITRDPTAVAAIEWSEPSTRLESKWATLLPPPGMPECPDVPGAMKMLQEMGEQFGITGVSMTPGMERPAGASVH